IGSALRSMVLRMSISSVPGTSSVFFASFPICRLPVDQLRIDQLFIVHLSIDHLPIDKVWEKVRAFAATVKREFHDERPGFWSAAARTCNMIAPRDFARAYY